MKSVGINFQENKIKFKIFILKAHIKFDFHTEASGNLSPFIIKSSRTTKNILYFNLIPEKLRSRLETSTAKKNQQLVAP